jgi:phosphoribulokinase
LVTLPIHVTLNAHLDGYGKGLSMTILDLLTLLSYIALNVDILFQIKRIYETKGSSDVLFYEGLHGAVKTDKVDVAQYADLLIGIVPSINLEWIQKLHRDKAARGQSHEAVVDTILRRMPDYVHCICPQFSETHVNFQRVPVVDTSNPFSARHIPSADESMLIIRFRNPRGVDFPYLLSMLEDSFISRANTIVCPGGKMPLAMQLIFTPMIWKLIDRRRRLMAK